MSTRRRGSRGSWSSSRFAVSKGLVTIGIATVLLFVVCAVFARSSVSPTSLQGMLPIAAVLAVAGLGQMLVVQQGGIDLSVAGAMSLAVVTVTHLPDQDNALLLPAVLLAIGFAVIAGLANGVLIGGLGLNPIIATLGTNALLYGVEPRHLRRPAPHHDLGAAERDDGLASLGIPIAVVLRHRRRWCSSRCSCGARCPVGGSSSSGRTPAPRAPSGSATGCTRPPPTSGRSCCTASPGS